MQSKVHVSVENICYTGIFTFRVGRYCIPFDNGLALGKS
jgi:hypothetical protein